MTRVVTAMDVPRERVTPASAAQLATHSTWTTAHANAPTAHMTPGTHARVSQDDGTYDAGATCEGRSG